MTSSPVVVPTVEALHRLRAVGRTVGYNGIHIYLRYRAILKLIEGRRFRRVLSVGCGFGIFDRLLPPDLEYEGLDLGEAEIDFARAWADAERPSYRYARERFLERDYDRGAFDLIILSEVLEHMPEEEVRATLQRAVDLLEPGGHLLVTVPNRLHLRNRVRRLLGQPLVWMDPTHLREYRLVEARQMLGGLPVLLRRFEAAVLYFPYEARVARALPAESPVREWITARVPSIASHFLMLAEKRA